MDSSNILPCKTVKRCMCLGCKNKISLCFFKCKFCSQLFCTIHQLPENHNCNIQGSDAFRECKQKDLSEILPMNKQHVHRYIHTL